MSQQSQIAETKERNTQKVNAELAAQINILNSENQSLREDLREACSRASDASASLLDRDQQILELRKDLVDQKTQLSEQLVRHAREFAELHGVTEQKRKLQAQVSGLAGSIGQQETRFEAELKALRASHQRDVKNQLRSSASSLTSARIELGHYQKQESELKNQISELARQNTMLQKLAEEYQQSRMQAEKRFEVAEIGKSKRDAEVSALNERLSSLRDEFEVQQRNQTRERSRLEGRLKAAEEARTIAQNKLEKELANAREQTMKASTRKVERSNVKAVAKRKPGSVAKNKDTDRDLTSISGIGPVAAENLRKHGVKTIKQIAAWTRNDVQRFGEILRVGGRIKKEKWVQQAKKLIQ